MVHFEMVECLQARVGGVGEDVKPFPIRAFDALESEQYGTSFFCENGTVILNAMTVAMINEDSCYRDPLGVFRTVSLEWYMSWKSISYGEILIVVSDGWRVRLPRRGELEDDVRSLELPPHSVAASTFKTSRAFRHLVFRALICGRKDSLVSKTRPRNLVSLTTFRGSASSTDRNAGSV